MNNSFDALDRSGTWHVNRWIAALDQLRGLAALAVVVHHVAQQTGVVRIPMWGPLLEWLGSWGVLLFFVLSGFCVHLPAARQLPDQRDLRIDFPRFYIQRARRILPPYFAALGVSALTGMYFPSPLISQPSPLDFLSHIFLVHTFTGHAYGINAVFWSIAVEVQFYICYPIFISLRNRVGSGRLVLLLAAFGIAGYGVISVLLPHGDRVPWQNMFLVRWWQWALGAWLAEVYVRGTAGRVASTLVNFRGAWLVWLTVSLIPAWFNPSFHGFRPMIFIAAPLCGVALLSAAIAGSTGVRGLGVIGEMSYSLYLVHPIALALLAVPVSQLALGASIPVLIVGSMVAGLAFYLCVERFSLSGNRRALRVGSAAQGGAGAGPVGPT